MTLIDIGLLLVSIGTVVGAMAWLGAWLRRPPACRHRWHPVLVRRQLGRFEPGRTCQVPGCDTTEVLSRERFFAQYGGRLYDKLMKEIHTQ